MIPRNIRTSLIWPMRIEIKGVVQGVGFRPTVYRIATAMGLRGYVQNLGSHVVIEVDRDAEAFVSQLQQSLPPLAELSEVRIKDGAILDDLGPGFRIIPSGTGIKGVGIPNDSAICANCRREMFNPADRRFQYPFTNCTDCGARFTIIEDLPYDREKTSMRDFPLCEDCRREYEDPADRRFHHQTISCPRCGPSFYLLDGKGQRMEGEPIKEFAGLLHDGAIGVAKSWGGMHICCTLATLPRLREWYRRKQKPFAVMVRDLEAAERYSTPSELEKEQLSSKHRPIVLVPKKEAEINELISPGLGNIGIFLPYTEMQHLLFSHLQEDALVMTSANVPGEPMVLRDEDALGLGAEYYLLHDREVLNRCDDSVLRVYGNKTFFLRKSRGHIPSGIPLPMQGEAVGVGAQESIAGAVAAGGTVFATQYIGDASSYGVLQFLEGSLAYQMRLLGVEGPRAVGIDLHPGYSTRRLGKELAERWKAELVEVQHHWAHAAALMVDAGLDEMVALTLDGTGYGADGVAWGGEVLHADFGSFTRVGHLQEIPLLGGEKAVYDVRRLAFGITEQLGISTDYFDDAQAQLLRKMMRSSPKTTSFGRVLDALACYFDVCDYRSYDGEPAMKLERHLENGRNVPIMVEREGNVIMSVPMFRGMVEAKGTPDDKAYSYVRALLKGLVDVAAEEAERHKLKHIGLTGGVSYNHTIASITEELVTRKGFLFAVPERLPNGDGCISTGQVAVALRKTQG